jgi:hypothetical protein
LTAGQSLEDSAQIAPPYSDSMQASGVLHVVTNW